jgi:hypothetical protein
LPARCLIILDNLECISYKQGHSCIQPRCNINCGTLTLVHRHHPLSGTSFTCWQLSNPVFYSSGTNPELQFVLSCHISLVSFDLWQFICLSLTFLTLMLSELGKLFCRIVPQVRSVWCFLWLE